MDISTGQNVYVTSLLEAVRGVLVYDKLNNLLQCDKGIDVKIAYAPPIFIRIKKHELNLITRHQNLLQTAD
ncbi:MAG: hypothetical protein QXL46_05495 [Nitrososphaerales archaeon]